MGKRLKQAVRLLWQGLRQLSGEDAYERYLEHFARYHNEPGATPLTKAEFFKRRQDRKWQGVNRCC